MRDETGINGIRRVPEAIRKWLSMCFGGPFGGKFWGSCPDSSSIRRLQGPKLIAVGGENMSARKLEKGCTCSLFDQDFSREMSGVGGSWIPNFWNERRGILEVLSNSGRVAGSLQSNHVSTLELVNARN